MSLIAALSIEVGASIAKSILKFWLKDSDIAVDATSTVVDMLKSKTTLSLNNLKILHFYDTPPTGTATLNGEALLIQAHFH